MILKSFVSVFEFKTFLGGLKGSWTEPVVADKRVKRDYILDSFEVDVVW